MKKTIIWIIALVLIGAGVFAYYTRPVAAPKVDVGTATTENQLTVPTDSTQKQSLYRISQNDSTVKFSIKEELRGEPFTAVGTSDQIAGDVVVTDDTLSLGKISIDARTFKTESPQRDGAINRLILKTDTNPYITFTPNGPVALSGALKTDMKTMISIPGTLTISGISKPATLAVTVTKTAVGITATVSGTIKRSDYSLTIPNIPFVANVSDSFDVGATLVAPSVQ